MNPTQRQQPTREQVIEHLKGQIAIRKVSLGLTERKRALHVRKMKWSEDCYEACTLLFGAYEMALEESSIEISFLDLQIADMKMQLEQLESALKQTESSILNPAQHGVMM